MALALDRSTGAMYEQRHAYMQLWATETERQSVAQPRMNFLCPDCSLVAALPLFSASVYYTKPKPKNKNWVGLGMRLS